MDFVAYLFGYDTQNHKIKNIRELESELLEIYERREKDKVEKLFMEMLDDEFSMNSVGTSGPLFCFVLDLKPFLTVNIIKRMIDGGLDFGHIHMRGYAHRKMFRELEFNYSDILWGIFIFICQHSNFVVTLPPDELFDILFGKIMIEKGKITFEFEPNIMVFKIMLNYDKRNLIKKTFLLPENASIRECVKQNFPEISNAIINN